MVDQEWENYVRIDKLLGIGTDTLREKFTSNIRPSTCEDYFNKNKHKIYHLWKPKKCIHCTSGKKGAAPLVKKQWEAIFLASSNPCSESIGDCWCGYVARSGLTLAGMDITLISCLLLNILQLSQCDKNYVENIRKLRNTLAHEHPNRHVPNAVFEKLWKDCSDNIRNLATTCSSDFANQINEQIKNLRSMVLGENRQITVVQKTVSRMSNMMSMKLRRNTKSVQDEGRKTRKYLQSTLNEFKGEIASSESRMKLRMDKQKKEIIKEFKQTPVDWKRKQQLEGEIERSREEIEGKRERTTFVPTHTFTSALNLLKGNTRFLILIGLPGDGKTTIGNFLVHNLVEPGGIDNHRRYPLVIDTPTEFKKLVRCNENLVIFIDNMFGTLNVHQQVAEDWKTRFPHMSACLKDTTNPNCNYLIVCIRKNIFSECLTSVLSKLDIYNDDCVIDLQSEKYCLTFTEKQNIFYSFPGNASVKKSDIISACHQAKHIGFPQCCKLFSGSKATVNLRFRPFENPRGFLDNEFKSMLRGTQKDKLCFCVLSMVMFMGGKLCPDQCRVNSMSPDDKAMLHSVLKMCGLDFKDSICADILDLINSFKGVYLKHEQPEDAFSFEHDCLHETMAMVLYERDPGMVIKYCRINFLSSLTNDKNNTCGMFVSQKLYIEIIARIEKELDTQGKRDLFITLAEMNLWGDREFLELFKNKILVCFPKILQSSKFKEGVTSLMICAAEVGNINLVRFLHSYDPQQVTNSEHALNKAVEMGKEAVLNFLLTFAKTDIDTAKSAVRSGNIDILKQIMGICACSEVDIYKLFFLACEEFREDIVRFLYSEHSRILNKGDENNWTALHWAAKHGSLSLTKYLIENGLGVLERTDNHMNILHIACQNGHLEVANYLISNYSDLLHMKDKDNTSAIHWAACSGNVSLVEMLIERGLDVFAMTTIRKTVLHIACKKGHTEMVKMLSEKYNKLLSMNDEDYLTVLHYAAMSGNVSLVETLIELGSDVFALTTIGQTVLHFACKEGHTEMVKMLSANYNGLLSMTDNDNMTVLHYAARSGNVSLVETLIESGVDVFAVTSDRMTCLLNAAINGHTQLAKFLSQKYNGLLSMNDEHYWTVLHYGAMSGNVSLVETLIELGSDVFALTTIGQTVLHIACEEGHTELAKFLSEKNNQLLSMNDEEYWTVLHYAATSGNVSLVETLIELGSDVFALTTAGKTVLHIACEEGHTELAKFLSQKNNRLLSMTDNAYLTVLHYAAKSGNVSLVETLIELVSEVFALTTAGQTVLHFDCKEGHTKMVKMLYEKHNGLISMTDNAYLTVLHYAAMSGNVSLVETLIELGSDVFALTTAGQTVLHFACREGHTEMVNMLSAKYNGLYIMTDKDNMTVLHYAARSGNVSLVETLIELGSDVFALTTVGQTVLHFACKEGHTEMVKMLSEKYNGLLSMNDEHYWTILHYAAMSGNVSLVEALIEIGSEVFALTTGRQTVLHIACEEGQKDLVKMLSENYYGLLSMTDNYNMTVLHYAARSGNVSLVETLIESGVDVFAVTSDGITCLHIAAINGHTQLAKFLFQKYNRLLSMNDEHYWTVLHYAAMSGNVSLVETLIELGSDVFALTTIRETVLHIACEEGHTELAKFLFQKYNRLLSMNGEHYWTVLHYAASSGNVSLVETLIELGSDVFALTTAGKTVLHIACEEGHTELAKFLSQKNNRLLSMTDNAYLTVLHYAAKSGNVSLVETLIELGSEVFALTTAKQTVLHFACKKGHTKMVKMLYEKHNGLISMNDEHYWTVLHYAAMSGNVSLVETLIELGSDVFALTTIGQTVLHIACEVGHTELAKFLSEKNNQLLSMNDEEYWTVLHYAAKSGNVSLVETLIELGSEVFALTTAGQTVLHFACKEGHTKMVKMLYEKHNGLISMTDNAYLTVLHYAAMSGNVSLVETLIELGSDVFALTTAGQTVLHFACREGHTEMVKMLSAKYNGLYIMTDKDNMTVLHYAARSGNVSLVETLIELGSDVFALTTVGQTVLHFACKEGHTEMVKMLSEKYNGLLSMNDEHYWTVLHYAAMSGNVSLVEALIELGSEVFALTTGRQTVLHIACREGHTEMVKMLSERYNGLLSMNDEDNMTVLHYAAMSGNVSFVETLIELGSDVFALTTGRQTVLHIACEEGQTDLVKMLSANYNGLLSMNDEDNMTVLHYAARSGNVSLVETLIELGSEVFALTTAGQTVLHFACKEGHTKMVKMLYEKHNGLISMTDNAYLTVLHYAAMSGNVSLVETLIELGSDVFALTTAGQTVLHFACKEGHTEMVKMLSEKYNGLLSMNDEHYWTVLHYAAMSGNVSLVEALIELGSDVFALTTDRQTVLHIACEEGQTDLVKMLSANYNGLLSMNDEDNMTVLHYAARSGNVSLVETLIESGVDVFTLTDFGESVLDIASELGHTELTKMLSEKYNLAAYYD